MDLGHILGAGRCQEAHLRAQDSAGNGLWSRFREHESEGYNPTCGILYVVIPGAYLHGKLEKEDEKLGMCSAVLGDAH